MTYTESSSSIYSQSVIKKEKNTGIELLRIISMLMVVILHCLGHGGILDSVEKGSINYIAAWFLECCCYGAVDIYAITTGYVYINSKTRFSKIGQLWLQAFIYTAGITFIFKFFIPGYDIGFGQLIGSFFPVLSRHYWYLTAYFCLYLFIPFINNLLQNLSSRKRQYLVFLIFSVFCLTPFFCIFYGREIFALNDGYSPFWLMLLYIIGATIKLNEKEKIHNKNYLYLVCFVISAAITLTSKLSISYVNSILPQTLCGEDLFISYFSPFVVVGAFCIFMFFKNLKIKYLKKIITAFGSASFGVYLISEQQIIKEVFIRNSLAEYTTEPWYIMISATVIYALIIYFVCACIDYIRIQLFYICKINKLLLILEKKIKCISDLVIKKIYSKIKSHN